MARLRVAGDDEAVVAEQAGTDQRGAVLQHDLIARFHMQPLLRRGGEKHGVGGERVERLRG